MTQWNLDDIEGLPTDPVQLRAWVGRLRALFRQWADMKPNGHPEEAFAKASKVMAEIRAMLGLPSAEQEIAAMQAAEAATGAENAQVAPITVEQVKAGKFTRTGMGDGSDKHGKFAVHFSRSIACGRLHMVKKFWLREGGPAPVYSFHVDVDVVPGDSGHDFPTVTEAVAYINANPAGA